MKSKKLSKRVLLDTEKARFTCVEDDGTEYTVFEWQEWVEAGNLGDRLAKAPGRTYLRLPDGGRVVCAESESDAFNVCGTEIVIRRVGLR